MDYQELTSFFGGMTKSAKALGTDRRNVNGWKKLRIPSHWQIKAEALSNGKIKADPQAKAEGKEMVEYVEYRKRKSTEKRPNL